MKQSTIHLAGVALGVISTILIYPQNPDLYGLARFLLDSAAFLAPFVLIGLNIIPIRFFPKLKDPGSNHHGLVTILIIAMLIACGLFTIFFLAFREQFLEWLAPKNPEFGLYFMWILPLTILTALTSLIYNYISNFGRIAIPYFFSNVLIKIGLPLLILLALFDLFSIQVFVKYLVLVLGLAVLGLIWYLWSIGELKISWPNFNIYRSLSKEIATYGLFGVLGGVGSVMAFKIDSIMISSFQTFQNNGIYNIGLYIANTISAPAIALAAISGPIISMHWNKGEKSEIEKIYKSSSITLLIFGGLALILILCSIHDLIVFFPKRYDYTPLSTVILFLGLARIFDMAASVNNQIIIYSDYYKFHLIAMLVLGSCNVGLNYYLLVVLDYGIIGAAIATSISLFLFNLIKFLFIYFKLKMHPFSKHTLTLLLIALGTYVIGRFIKLDLHPISNIILRSVILGVLYLTVVYYSRISPEANDLVRKLLNQVKKRS